MNKEVLFAQTLEQVRKTAKEQGNCISEEQVKEAFAELDLSNEQLQMVFDYLLKHKIGIGQPMDPDEFLTEEEKDYLQEYLDEVAALPTYSDGEKLAFSIAAMAGETDASGEENHPAAYDIGAYHAARYARKDTRRQRVRQVAVLNQVAEKFHASLLILRANLRFFLGKALPFRTVFVISPGK